MKGGTIRSLTVGEDEAGIRLDIFLASFTDLSRSRVKELIKKGYVTIGGNPVIKPSHLVEAGSTIDLAVLSVSEPDFLAEHIPLNIVFQDDHIIVINKPAGMVVHPARGHRTGTLAAGLLYHCKKIAEVGDPLKPGIVHRLDMNTSGLLVAALSIESHEILSRMVGNHEIQRIYTAYVWGHPEPKDGTVNAPIGRHPKYRLQNAIVQDGRPSVTHYKSCARYEFLSKLEVILQTGRTHQIRVHMASIGHHVFGDPLYGGRNKRLKGISTELRIKARHMLDIIDRQALHAARLDFNHPITGKELSFEAPLPDDLLKLQRQLDDEK